MSTVRSMFKRLERDRELLDRAKNAPPRPEGSENGSYVLHISLVGSSKPPVWRRLRVPSQIKFGGIHRCIQTAFGWTNSHLHRFAVQTHLFIQQNPFFGKVGYEGGISDGRILFEVVLKEGAEIVYEYD